MDSDIAQEARRMKRYFIIRVISRGGDVIIYAVLLLIWGIEWLIPAFIISGIFDYTLDFFGQKLWAFEEKDRRLVKLLREFGFYLLIRGGNLLCAGGLWLLLHEVFGVPILTTSLIVIVVFWTLSFGFYRWLFAGSIKDLPAVLKSVWVAIRTRVRLR